MGVDDVQVLDRDGPERDRGRADRAAGGDLPGHAEDARGRLVAGHLTEQRRPQRAVAQSIRSARVDDGGNGNAADPRAHLQQTARGARGGDDQKALLSPRRRVVDPDPVVREVDFHVLGAETGHSQDAIEPLQHRTIDDGHFHICPYDGADLEARDVDPGQLLHAGGALDPDDLILIQVQAENANEAGRDHGGIGRAVEQEAERAFAIEHDRRNDAPAAIGLGGTGEQGAFRARGGRLRGRMRGLDRRGVVAGRCRGWQRRGQPEHDPQDGPHGNLPGTAGRGEPPQLYVHRAQRGYPGRRPPRASVTVVVVT